MRFGGSEDNPLSIHAARFLLLLGICAALGAANCQYNVDLGGRSHSGAPTLKSITLSPINPTISTGAMQQFFATAVYTGKDPEDVSKSATWTSSDPTTVAIENSGQTNPGMATGVARGTAVISASFGGMTSSTSLTVASNAAEIPLQDMSSTENYLGYPGGLYENSSDSPPADHNSAGLTAASAIQPLDASGNPSPQGKVVLVSVGRSNAQEEFGVFATQAAADSRVNHTTLVIANGALDAEEPCAWTVAYGLPPCNPSLGNEYDRVRDTVLAPLGVSEQQVQAIWIEEYNADPAGDGFEPLCDATVAGCSNDVSHTEALRLEQQLGGILRAAKTRWPNLRQTFHSSRIYGGYSTTNHSSEPYAYEYGYSVKWLIQAQIVQARNGGGSFDPVTGDLNYQTGIAPWTAWGPYLWANGATPRSDGLVWCNGQPGAPCSGEIDFQGDGTHPDSAGQHKVSNLLMNFFLNSPFTPWFRP